jgi:hypothetical protein
MYKMTEKYCKDCMTMKILETDYYLLSNKKAYFNVCKKCHNQQRKKYESRYVKKKCGFQKLEPDTQLALIEDMKTMNLTAVAAKYNIKYPTIRVWKNNGTIKMYL